MKRWQSLLLGLIISGGALYVAVRGAQLDRVVVAMRTARYQYAVVGLVIISASTYVRGLRWSTLLEGRLAPTRAFWLFNAGFLFNNVLPFRIGEVVRVYLATRNSTLRFAEVLSSIVIERLMDMLNVVAMLAVLLQIPTLAVPAWASQAGLVMLAGSVAGIVVLYLAARSPEAVIALVGGVTSRLPLPDRWSPEQIAGQTESFLDGLVSLRTPRVFLTALAYSTLAWLMSGATGWIMLFAFPEFGNPGLEIGFLAVAAAGLGIAVPSLPGAVGPFEAAVKLTLVAVGFGQALSLSYALVLHAASFIATSVLGAIGLVREGLSFGQVASAARDVGKPTIDTPDDAGPEHLTA